MKWICAECDLIESNKYDDANRCWFYTKTFKHDETELSLREKNLQLKMEQKENTIRQMQASIFYLTEQLNLAKTNAGKYMHDNIGPFIEIAKSVGSLVNKPEDKYARN